MPTLDQAHAALEAALAGSPPNQTIDLVAAATRPALVGLAEPLALLRAGTTAPVVAVTLTRPRGEVLLTGSGTFAVPGGPGVPAAVRLTATEPTPGVLVFTLASAVERTGWTFGTSFPTLPHTLRAASEGPTVTFGESALAPLRVDRPVFIARSGPGERVRMTGALQPTGDLVTYRHWTDGWPLELTGTVTLPESAGVAPELDLRATASSARISVPPLVLDRPGFALVAHPEPDGGEPDVPPPPPYSELQVVGTATLAGERPIVARLSAPLLVGHRTWRLLASFGGTGPSLAGGLGQLAGLFGLEVGDLRTPPGLGGFETFTLDEVEAWIDGSPSTGLADLRSIAATIRSTEVWEPPIPFLRVTDVGTRWVLSWTPVAGRQRRVVAGSVFGAFVFDNGPGEEDGVVDVVGLLPSFVVEGTQREDTAINVAAAFRQLLGRRVPAVPGDPEIRDLTLYADPRGQIFSAGATLGVDWPVPFFAGLNITELDFEVTATASTLAGAVGGRLRLGPGPLAPALRLRAEAPESAGPADPADPDAKAPGWVFSGGLEPEHPLTLGALLRLLHFPAAADLDVLAIDRLDGRIDTGTSAWTLSGALSARWHPTLLGQRIDVAAGVEVDLRRPDATKSATGWVAGSFSVNRFRLRLQRDVGVLEPTYALRVEFGGLWLNAATAWVDDRKPRPALTSGPPGLLPSGVADPSDSDAGRAALRDDDPPVGRHQVVAIQLGGATLGEVLEEIVHRAAPTLGFSLDPPWDVLGRIELSRFTLTIDPKDRVVALTYAVDADLVVMRIDTIGVRYAMGEDSAVDLILTGSFLGKEFREKPGSKPLSWDVVNDPPPAVPGKGPKLVELRYLGLGQRIRLSDPQPDTVAEAIARLRADMPERDPDENPLVESRMVFDAASQWLVALDLRVLETVEVGLIFNDPRLYGLFVGLDGERAGPLAGLRFEILYKQLSPGLGMFRVELRLPDAFRHIELGEVSITLGTVVVEVYTNGNFLVDLGFPHDRDFTRAFTVQVFPFIGRGGIYFGLLNGATSRRLPAITNGTFSPVLELGIGLAVGVGKEISVGPLSGGAYVELEVLFQGVLAWFHPTGSDAASDRYHWAQGIVAIHGKVYGEVDFAVVKASVTLEAYAQASVVLESYRATRFALEVRVRAEAEIEILFVTVSFSFDVELDLSFTVGADRPVPWALAATQPPRLDTGRAPHRLAVHQEPAVTFDADRPERAWPTDFSAFGAPRTLPITVAPAFAIDDAAVSWTDAAPVPVDLPAWRVAFLLFAPNGVAPAARTAAQATSVAPTNEAAPHDAEADGTPVDPSPADPPPLPAASIVEAFLRWALHAVPGGSSPAGWVTAGELAALGRDLARPEMIRDVFTCDRLGEFFSHNLHLTITGDGSPAAPVGAMAVPPPPWLQISTAAAGFVPATANDLYARHPVGQAYAAGAAEYMARYSPVPNPAPPEDDDDPAHYVSFAAQAFCDWALLVTREAVRQAGAALDRTTVPMVADLEGTARSLPRDTVSYAVRPGDTVATVADWLGAGVGELEALNDGLAGRLAAALPGDRLDLLVGVAACTLAVDNATRPLAPGVQVVVTDVPVLVRSRDTLDAVSARAYGTADAGRLVREAGLGGLRGLLRPGATVAVPARTGMGSDLPLLAATAYVRYTGDLRVTHAEWYAQAVADLNREALQALDPGQPLPAGVALTVPTGYESETTTTYTVRAGDSLLTVGATLSLAQDPGGYAAPAWRAFRTGVVGDAGGTVPAATVPVLPGETLDALAARLLVPDGADGLVPWLHSAPVLDALAVVVLPALPLASSDHPTLAAMAAASGLTVDALARRPEVARAAGLFAAGTALTVRHLPTQDVNRLVAAVCAGDALSSISTQASRTLLGGLRLPAPVADPKTGKVTATGAPAAFADLAGWQVPAPPLDGTSALRATIAPSPTGPAQTWITLVGGPTSGTAGCTADATTLEAEYPAAGLARVPTVGPAALPTTGVVPRTYGLDHRIDLQAAVVPAIPGGDPQSPVAGATLWRFPAALTARATAGSTVPYDLLRSTSATSSVVADEHVHASTFGTLLPLGVRRTGHDDGVLELVGADTPDRDLLLALARAAAAAPSASPTRLYLGIAPVPGATDPRGLALLDVDPQATVAIRANLATDVPLDAPPTVLTGVFGDPERFLRLAWEASVAGGGFHLALRTADGTGLPPGAFSDDGTATLWLLAIDGAQQAPAPAGRTLRPTDTCALIADGLDGTSHTLYLEAHDAASHPDELVPQALVPAGSMGVTLTVPRPFPPAADAPLEDRRVARLAQLLSLLVVGIESDTYSTAHPAPAAPPLREDGRHQPSWLRQRELRTLRATAADGDPPPAEHWRYDQVVPLSTVGPASPAPAVPGLPDPATDPYRGFGTAATPASATFVLRYADVLGNLTRDASAKAVDVEVGYTDPLLGPSAWPGATTGFAVVRADGVVTLTVTVTAQPGTVVPGPGGAREAATDAAQAQAERYATAYLQLAQTSVDGQIATTLHQGADGRPVAVDLREGTAPLWRFTAAAHVYARAASTLVDVPLAGLATLGGVTARHGLPGELLGAANAGVPFSRLAVPGQSVTVMARLAVAAGDSADTLRARIPDGWPHPADGPAVLRTGDNPALPLRAGAVLAITPVAVRPDAATATLRALADAHHTTAARLATDNAARPVLRVGFAFSAGDQVVTVGEPVPPVDPADPVVLVATLDDVRRAFERLSVDVAVTELADAAADQADLLADGAELSLEHLVAVAGDTLATLPGTTVDDLSGRNAGVPDLFPAGTGLALGDVWASPPTVPADTLETLGQFAAVRGTTPAAVLAVNPALRLAADAPLVLPGLAALPPDPPLVPGAALPGDDLSALATRFATSPDALVTANAAMPGLVAPGRAISVPVGSGSVTTTTTVGDTFAAVVARLHAQDPAVDLAAVVAATQDDATLLVPGALVLAAAPPLAPPAGAPAAATLTVAAAAGAFGLDPLALAQANAALPGLVAPGIAVAAPADAAGHVATERTAPADSLNAVLSRFAARGVPIDLAGLLAANATVGLLVAGTRVLLPPAAVAVSAPIGDGTGPFADPVFPVVVDLRLQRTHELVLEPTPGRDGPVERSDTRVPAPTAPTDRDGQVSETLDAFVTAFEAAFDDLRVGTARVAGERADLWAVDFGPRGIATVDVRGPVTHPDGSTGHPRVLALRPLYPALQSRQGVEVPVLDDDGATVPDAHTATTFQGVDVEGWAQTFLTDLDRFTSADYAAAIRGNAASVAALDTLLRARFTVANGIARGLSPVLVATDPGAAAGRAAAVPDVARACGAGLVAGYGVAAVVQYDAAVGAAYGDPTRGLAPARLVGGAQPPKAPTPPDAAAAPSTRDFGPAAAGLGPAAVGSPPDATDPTPPPPVDGDFSLTTTSVALDAATAHVGFAMTVPDPTHHARVATGPLELAYDAVQFGIDRVRGLDGYVDADWVTLVRPLTGDRRPAGLTVDLGSPEVPVPLRAHPPVPLVLGQQATATYEGDAPPTLKQAAEWTFGLTYAHEHAEQDEVLLAVTFNAGSRLRLAATDGTDLAAALGTYVALADRLRELMAWYVAPPVPAPTNLPAVRDAVAGTVAGLVDDVAAAWSAHWPAGVALGAAGPQTDVPAGETFHFRVAVDYVDGTPTGTERSAEIAALTLTLDGGTSPGPTGAWPSVRVRAADGTEVPFTPTATGTTCRYVPAAAVPVSGWPAVHVAWPGLNVAAVADGHASLAARRNAELVPGVPTDAAFVLGSASVTAPEAATPLLEWSLDLSIAGPSFAQALQDAFTALFGAATGPVATVALGYAHELVPADPDVPGSGIVSVLPVALLPRQPLSPDLAAAVAAVAAEWQDRERPVTAGGSWQVSLTLSGDPDAGVSRPLLVLDRLVRPLDA
jgi:hypothetical protein